MRKKNIIKQKEEIKIPKYAKVKKCPYLDTIIKIGSGKNIYWCYLFCDKKACIFAENIYKMDAGECSYYLFPKENYFILNLGQLCREFRWRIKNV